MFASVYAQARELCVTDRIVVVKGRVDHKQEGETKLLASELSAFEAISERREVRLRLDASKARAGVIGELARRAARLPRRGARARRPRDGTTARGRSSSGRATASQPVPDFFAEVKALLGEAAVR